MKARRLKTIAAWINANMEGYSARIEKGYCNTDRKPKGARWRIPGKGRTGNLLKVLKGGVVVFRHNAAETYRSNDEVERWVEDHRDGKTCGSSFCRACCAGIRA